MNGNNLPTKIDAYHTFNGGIAPYNKESQPGTYAHGRSLDVRSNPREATILPKTTKESGSVYQALPMDADRVGNTTYIYDQAGNIYTRSSAGSHSLVRTVANSHGNGMRYFGEDDFLYYPSDKVIGRYGQLSGTPTFVDDFLGSEGGVPLNTHWLDLESGSSEYASRADTASTSITGDLAMEATIKPESLPTVGNSMVIMSKWDVNTNLRSYKLDILTIAGFFGDGTDGALTISGNTTQAPKDATCTGTTGTTSLSYASASGTFVTGEKILIHQTQGTGAGTWQRNTINGVSGTTSGTLTLETPLTATYGTGAQVIQLKQYSSVTVNSSVTWTAKAWTGSVGGILAFLCSGTITINGTISASERGFYQSSSTSSGNNYLQGDSATGVGGYSYSANGTGGGGGDKEHGSQVWAGGGGGGHSTGGGNGQAHNGGSVGVGGGTGGTADLTTMIFGGAGGHYQGSYSTSGGIVYASGATITMGASGLINVNGGNSAAVGGGSSSGGGSAGGSCLLNAQTATLGTNRITAAGGVGGASEYGTIGGAGGIGRIHVNYYTSISGTASPTIDSTQDNTLVSSTSYQLRVGISSTGTNEEFLTKVVSLTAGTTYHIGASWDASTSTATFCINGASVGTSVGTLTAINNNASRFAVGADFNSSARNFFDGKIDEARLWNTERTADQFNSNKETEIAVNSVGLAAYYQFDNNWDDSTSNANHLTTTGGTFTTDVPFASSTTRLDLDQSLDTSGNTYTTPTSITETASNRQTFVPDKDPQKSIEVLVAAIGTGNWTITVHDSLNRTVASKTVTNANMHTGDYEFTFSSVWRPVRGASYHFHLTSTVNDGTVTTTTSSDLETVDFHTYYQFLVEDEYHPAEQILNLMAFGNERYLATYDATEYIPHRLVLPPGWRIRCLTKWQGYLAIGCWKGDNVSDYDQGMIFFWDGFSTTYNDFIEVPEGAINAMLGSQGTLYIWAGYQGQMLEYTGGAKATKVRKVPKMVKGKSLEVYPKAVNMWQSLLRFGIAGTCDSTDVERGVYTIGQENPEDPVNALTYDYPISTGTTASTGVQIGLVFPFNKKLLIGWKDNVSYGVDVIDPAGSPYATATIERDIKDYGGVWKEKQAMLVRADFKELNSGETIQLKYKLDRDTNWTQGDVISTAGLGVARLPINMGNHKEVQIAADLATSVSTAPTVLELTLEEDLKSSENMI